MRDQVFDLINAEEKRQREQLLLIPSENYASVAVREAMGSVFANKYAEGYPGKRYYQGNEFVDQLERLCQERAKKLFGVPYVNVQPLSGSPANLAIIKALTNKDDIHLSQHLSTGGHLSMGQEASITGEYRKTVFYHLDKNGEVDWEELERLAMEYKPKIIWSGGTGYTRIFNWEKYAEIADKIGAYFVADISHIGGLVAGGAHPSPVPYAHIVMTTTHKTLRGPRGAMIMVTQKGSDKDKELASKIDKAVFPGVQGGPHMENVASLAVALRQAQGQPFKLYVHQVIVNANILAKELMNRDYKLVGLGTENHMIWIDLRNKGIDGWTAAWALEAAGIIANRQTIPGETGSPYYPSGLRLGTPAVTTRGMKEPEMKKIAEWIDQIILNAHYLILNNYKNIGSSEKEKDQEERKRFKKEIFDQPELIKMREKVKVLCQKFTT